MELLDPNSSFYLFDKLLKEDLIQEERDLLLVFKGLPSFFFALLPVSSWPNSVWPPIQSLDVGKLPFIT
jgi:hypothetical protein